MNRSALIFMGLSWLVILALLGFCLARTLQKPPADGKADTGDSKL